MRYEYTSPAAGLTLTRNAAAVVELPNGPPVVVEPKRSRKGVRRIFKMRLTPFRLLFGSTTTGGPFGNSTTAAAFLVKVNPAAGLVYSYLIPGLDGRMLVALDAQG